MSEDASKTGAGGTGDAKPPVVDPPNPEGNDGDKGTVPYEAHRKLLSEKKKLQADLDKIKLEADEQKKTELENQQKYKDLYEGLKTENDGLKTKLTSHEDRWQDALKLNAFNSALGDTKKIESKFYGFIDTSKILVDPDTNKVDQVSVQKEVERVSREFPEIIKSTVKGNLPTDAPTGGKALTYQEWLKLPSKEMAARMKEVKD